MNKSSFVSFQVKRYRSLMDIKVDISTTTPVVICGENNIGKTNFLRALDLFFNHPFKDGMFNAKSGMPFVRQQNGKRLLLTWN